MSAAALLERARALDAQGRNDEARHAYLAALAADPKHVAALMGLAKLSAATRHSGAAKAALRQAIDAHPSPDWLAVAHANLATLLYDDGEEADAEAHYGIALRLDPNNRAANQGLAVLLLRRGETETAVRHGRLGYQGQGERWRHRGTGKPVSVLVTLSALGGNIPVHAFLDDRVFERWTLIAEFADPRAPLPPHDFALNCIGDADRCGAALTAAAGILALSPGRVLNPPARVLETSRARNAARLGTLPGVRTARASELPREVLSPQALEALGFRWPLLLRSPGFHTGQHFVKVDVPEALAAAVEALPGTRLLVMEDVDTRSQDGKFRKYRVMAIGGALYPLHLAVASQWKVHYLSADMADSAAHRAEDEAFLADMRGVLGPAAMAALERVRDCLGLDYGGIDFGLASADADAQVVVFEANATMVMLAPGEDPRWAYRAAPVERAMQALRQLLAGRP